MLLVVSPAKNLDFEKQDIAPASTQPELLEHSQQLIDRSRKLSPAQIGSLMKISDKLAGLNADRFAAWHTPFTDENAKQAVLAFNGDVYGGLDAGSFSEEDFSYAQKHMRILSGLYGLLKPLDLMQAYRLEMGTKLDTERGTNLYQFWGNIITEKLNQALAEQGDNVLVNLASTEYFSAVKPKALEGEIIEPVFKDFKNGQYKIISFYAKKVRGTMTNWLIKNKIKDAKSINKFAEEGYYLSKELSTPTEPVFLRD